MTLGLTDTEGRLMTDGSITRRVPEHLRTGLPPDAADRLNAKLERSDTGCLEWTGWRNWAGYGQLRIWGRRVGAHRVSWELSNGPIPLGMNVCHSCDNPPCVNVEHLFIGTQADNLADMWSKGRAFTPLSPGQSHPDARLTDEDVRRLRDLVAGGASYAEAGRQVGVSGGHARRVVLGFRRGGVGGMER